MAKAKHIKQELEVDDAQTHVEASQTAMPDEPEQTRRKKGRFWIIPALFLGILAGVYFGGAVFFYNNSFPNTKVNGQDASMLSQTDIAACINAQLGEWSTTVVGDGLSFTLTADDAKLTTNSLELAQQVIANNNPWEWPMEIGRQHNYDFMLTASADKAAVRQAIQPVLDQNTTALDNLEHGGLIYDSEQCLFVVPDEVLSLRVNGDVLADRIVTEATTLPSEIHVGEEVLITDDAVLNARDYINNILTHPIMLKLAGRDAYEIDGSEIINWLVLNDDLSVSVDEDALTSWARGPLSEVLDTVGKERSYTRPDGKEITVSGGRWGWTIDGQGAAPMIAGAILAGEGASLELPTLKEADIPPMEGGRDWADWIDVDITEQHAVYYSEDGDILWESNVVSGQPNAYTAEGVAENHSTPSGVYYVNGRYRNITLTGPILESTGAPEWNSFVNYWMPFIGGSVGLHDATWRYSDGFGGDIYTWYGSHGCVNLPLDNAETLYNMIEVGTCVVVHY